MFLASLSEVIAKEESPNPAWAVALVSFLGEGGPPIRRHAIFSGIGRARAFPHPNALTGNADIMGMEQCLDKMAAIFGKA
jgi:hypothetical protein